MNILFSTTCNWNVGDEIIMAGVVNLLQACGLRFNIVAYNRNPTIYRPGNIVFDNSFDTERHSFSSIDYVVFAGSPEWTGPRLAPLYDGIIKHNKRCAYIGIGTAGGEPIAFSPQELYVLKNQADLIITRDRDTKTDIEKYLPGIAIDVLPCPSLFSSPDVKGREKTGRTGIIYQTSRTENQDITLQERDQLIDFIWKMKQKTDITLICNYVDECIEGSELFGPSLIRYSFRQKDYQAFFREVDCVVGSRLHGCLGALSAGTPAILLGADNNRRRRGAADEFPILPLGDLNDPDQLVKQVLNLPHASQDAAIVPFKAQFHTQYQNLLKLKTGYLQNQLPMAEPCRNPEMEVKWREHLKNIRNKKTSSSYYDNIGIKHLIKILVRKIGKRLGQFVR